MSKTSLKAFTILEVLINIVIMSIIIGMVYFFYSSLTKQISFYRSDTEEENRLSNFCLQMKKDFFRSEKIVGTAESFDAIFYDTNSIHYEVGNKFLMRTQQKHQDSIQVGKLDITSKTDAVTGEDLILGVNISAFLFDEPIEFMVAKNYPMLFENDESYGN